MSQPDESRCWTNYYNAVTGRPPRPILLDAVARFSQPATGRVDYQAIDLGCGDGTETLALVQQGWKVLAIDKQPEAIARVQAIVPLEHHAQLQTQVSGFEDVILPPADLIYAGFSVPFCRPQSFAAFWAQVVAAVPPRGRFAGQLFGDRDSWANEPTMTFHTVASARALFNQFELEVFTEIDEDGQAVSGPKHWHVYNVIARKGNQT